LRQARLFVFAWATRDGPVCGRLRQEHNNEEDLAWMTQFPASPAT